MQNNIPITSETAAEEYDLEALLDRAQMRWLSVAHYLEAMLRIPDDPAAASGDDISGSPEDQNPILPSERPYSDFTGPSCWIV